MLKEYTRWLAAVAAVAVGTFGIATTAHQDGPAMPDSRLTPGKASTTSLSIICGTLTSTRRNVSAATKARVYAEYSITTHPAGSFEVDHLIPLALGGSNDITNLWPEPALPTPGFHQKDVLEVRLHNMVCAHQLPIRTAQDAIASNWYRAYQEYVKK